MRTLIEELQYKLEELYEVYGLSSTLYAEYNEHLMHIRVNQMYSPGAVAMVDYISREVDRITFELDAIASAQEEEHFSNLYSM